MRATATPGLPGQARRAELLMAAAVLFVVLTVAAMLAYPGGAKYHHSSTGGPGSRLERSTLIQDAQMTRLRLER